MYQATLNIPLAKLSIIQNSTIYIDVAIVMVRRDLEFEIKLKFCLYNKDRLSKPRRYEGRSCVFILILKRCMINRFSRLQSRIYLDVYLLHMLMFVRYVYSYAYILCRYIYMSINKEQGTVDCAGPRLDPIISFIFFHQCHT